MKFEKEILNLIEQVSNEEIKKSLLNQSNTFKDILSEMETDFGKVLGTNWETDYVNLNKVANNLKRDITNLVNKIIPNLAIKLSVVQLDSQYLKDCCEDFNDIFKDLQDDALKNLGPEWKKNYPKMEQKLNDIKFFIDEFCKLGISTSQTSNSGVGSASLTPGISSTPNAVNQSIGGVSGAGSRSSGTNRTTRGVGRPKNKKSLYDLLQRYFWSPRITNQMVRTI